MIAAQFDAFFLDLDGVVYIGDEPTPGTPLVLKELRRKGKEIRFLTNNPTSAEEIVRRLRSLGIESQEREVVTSGTATAALLAAKDLRKAWVLGHKGLKEALLARGVTSTEGDGCDAVVVGWNDDITMADIREASLAIRRGAFFVATNEDRTYPGPQGPLAAVGTLVEALVAGSGQRPISVGKPQPFMFDVALKGLGRGKRAVMIGDTPDVDILGAHRSGLPALLMGEAVTFPYDRDFRNPDGRIASLEDLFDESLSVGEWDGPSYAWPERVEPGVAAIVLEGERVLLMRRRDNGLWGIPSGHVEPTETVAGAVLREIREETGIEAEVTGLIGVYSDPRSQVMTYPDGRIRHFVTTCFLCRPTGGTLGRTGPETLDAGFFPLDSLPEPMMAMHPLWLADALAGSKEPFIR
ncbi:HAD-IIA family hydrolase [Aminithiophilus ramosus]|uniref:HAD-IIA family hydrolase n=2 Tax=Synergistales TaxID=649776 RepID=A0A9Q7EVW8_9BACT|nr:HAD-IIA family hydrolase [Aminithiophilus ramosus]QTX31225.1 HAD-IIA family hydrolase [Aminithiophilus ramosus]QVL35025.1 HAD-IIA family hydrolase [Synergistota bacterium]